MVETAALFVVVEPIVGQIVEPLLFGHVTGLSPLAVLMAAAFWTLIWGPAGLLLSTPLTACIAVLGRHVEGLSVIEKLIGDKPVLSPVQSFYQRVLAGDADEIAYQAETFAQDKSFVEFYDDVALPAILLAQTDVARGALAGRQLGEVGATIEAAAELVSEQLTLTDKKAQRATDAAADQPDATDPLTAAAPSRVLCLSGRNPLDHAACALLTQALTRRGHTVRVEGPDALSATGGVDPASVDAVVISYVESVNFAPLRFMLRRVRNRFSDVSVLACSWGKRGSPAFDDAVKSVATVSTIAGVIAWLEARPEKPKLAVSELAVRSA